MVLHPTLLVMSSNTADRTQNEEQKQTDGNEATSEGDADSEGLKIALPEGSESVSDAIVAHREMLNDPENNGLATEEDITHLSEAVNSLSGEVSELSQHHEERESDIVELRGLVEQQQEQIRELRQMVTSLAEILGTETEWDTFGDS